ncbi:hypothetical protein [Ascidiimonas sp. W6]|uniref:hypothetical protein n=1 Tax=Ascidiimonas meishanensis TaxID=3128903 RepID=UPI0030EE7A08
MSRPVLSLITIFLFTSLNAQQQLVNVSEILNPREEKEFLIAANTGDQIEIRLQRIKGSKIAEFSLFSFPNKLLFKEEKIKKLSRNLVSGKKGIYRFVIKNTSKKSTSYQFKVQLISKKENALKIGYKVKKDTTYAYPTSYSTIIEVEKTQPLQQEKFYLNSRSNALIKGGKNRIIFPVNLPENTIEWFYVFTASRNEADIQNTLKTFDLAGSLSKFIDQDRSLQNSVGNLSAPPGADICDIYLMDEKNARIFINKKEFEYQLSASRENYKSGIVEVSKNSKRKLFLGINNPDNIYGIHVSFEIIAIVKERDYVTKKINIPVITSYKVPYIE